MISSSDQSGPLLQGSTVDSTTRPWATRLLFLRILLITALLVGIFFWLASFVINPILILIVAALLAYAVVPVIGLFHRVMPRGLAILLVYVLALILGGGIGYLAVKTLIPELNALAKSVTTFVTPGSSGQESPLDQIIKSLGISQSQIDAAAKQLQSELGKIAADIANAIVPIVGGVISIGFNILITGVVSVYLVIDSYRFGGWLLSSLPTSQRGWTSSVLSILQRVVGGYIRGQIILSAIIGMLQGVGMAIIGVPFAPLIGVLAFILEFIPMIGTIVTGFLAVVIALTQSWTLALVTLVYTILIDMLEGYVLSPRILAKAVEIRPVVTLLAMIAGSQVFGVWGAIFAAPTAGLIQALVGTYWQWYQETHTQEFPLEKIGQVVIPSENATQPTVNAPAVNEK
jgi:predicted PurR-regulated permease PerM